MRAHLKLLESHRLTVRPYFQQSQRHGSIIPPNFRDRSRNLAFKCRPLQAGSGAKRDVCVKRHAESASYPSATETVQVVEYFILLQLSPDTGPEEAEALLSNLWSLKYAVPNVLCASAGEVCNVGAPVGNLQRFTHVAKFRFGSPATARDFQSHAKFLEVSSSVRSDSKCIDALELVAQVVVRKNLGDIFKSGGEWESGAELILMMKQEGAQGTVQTLADLAMSGGALQSCAGGATELSATPGSVQEKIIVCHFPSEHLSKAFVASEAVQILLGSCSGQRYFCFGIAPTDAKTHTKGPGGLL